MSFSEWVISDNSEVLKLPIDDTKIFAFLFPDCCDVSRDQSLVSRWRSWGCWCRWRAWSRLATEARRQRLTPRSSSCITGPPRPSCSSRASWSPAMTSSAPPSPASTTASLAMCWIPTAGSCPPSQFHVRNTVKLRVISQLWWSLNLRENPEKGSKFGICSCEDQNLKSFLKRAWHGWTQNLSI